MNVMSPEMRQTVLNGHNDRRSLLAQGKVKKTKYCSKKFPPAANMLKMNYDCALEEKAARMDLCKIIPPRERFRLRGRNYEYIETPMLHFRPILSPADALLAAMRRWWNTHLYHRGLEGLIPRKRDFPVLPFLMMANAKTPGVGCVVDLCRFANDTNLQTRRKYWAVVCLYTKPHVKKCKPFYTKGKPCSMCPCGYRCENKTKLCKKRHWKK